MSFDANMVLQNPEMLAQIAAQLDPGPILNELGGAGGGSSMNGPDPAWSGIVNPMTQPKTPAPLDPKSMMALNSLMPQPGKPQFMGGAAPRAGTPVNLHIPDISNLVKLHLGPGVNAEAPPTLGKLIGGR